MDNELCDPTLFLTTICTDPIKQNMSPKIRKKKLIKRQSNTEIIPSLEIRGAYPPLDRPDPIICYCDPNSRPKPKTKSVKSLSTTDIPSKILRLPSPMDIRINDIIPRFKSPELVGPKVRPRQPSVISQPLLEPLPYSKTDLELRKPKSGIVIQDSITGTILDSLSIGYDRPYAIDLIKKYGLFDYLSLGLEDEESVSPEMLYSIIEAMEEQSDTADDVDIEVEIEKPCAQIQTEPRLSVDSLSDVSTIEPPEYVSKWIQKFQRDHVEKFETPRISYKRQTLESHSFTNIKLSNKTVKEYKYGILLGNYDQSDEHFSRRTRNRQTLANLIVAYCFSFLKYPSEWSPEDIDDILEVGDQLFSETLDILHLHENAEEIKASELLTTIILQDKKFIYQISDPLIRGLTKSDDKTVYNLNKALRIFFKKYNCALFQTKHVQLIIWKTRFYFVFDPKPRAKDLFVDSIGAAAIMIFLDIETIVSMLIERTVMGNWPFTLSNVLVVKILDAQAPYDTGDSLTSGFTEANEYHVLGNEKAVISASFSMADPCFDWMSNRQALAICIIALIYTKVTPSAAWCRRTVDKILLLGNTLYYEIAIASSKEDIQMADIPSIFTLGPYKVKITILNSVVKGYMFSRKKYPDLIKGLFNFFDNSTLGIVQFHKFTYAIWNQRDYYYLFDPYPRDFEGFMKRHGTAILSMHNSIDALVETIMKNVDLENNCSFTIYALKEIKICVGGDELRPRKLEGAIDKLRMIKPMSQIKPICLDPHSKAEESFQPNTVPSESDVSIKSSVVSLPAEYVPFLKHQGHKMPNAMPLPRKISKESLGCCDLDSPSLSDTQIVVPKLEPHESELSIISDRVYSICTLMSLLEPGEGEGEDIHGDFYLQMYDLERQILAELGIWNEMEDYLQIDEAEYVFEEYYVSRKPVSATTMTEGFRLLEKKILRVTKLPESIYAKRKLLVEPQTPVKEKSVTVLTELSKETNFIPMPDGSEIICGTDSITNYDPKKISLMAPFVAIMAIVVSHKYAFVSWDSSILDYILTCGSGLYNVTPERFDEAAVHEFRRIVLGSTDFTAKSTYILDSIFKSSVIEQILNVLFRRCPCAIFANPNYSCAVFYKNFLYYLYDPYNSNAVGLGQGDNQPGSCCFIRFTSCHQLVARILYNKSKRESDLDCEKNRYVLSVVEVHRLPTGDEDAVEEPPLDQEQINIESCLKKIPIEQPQISGYQLKDTELVIMGEDCLRGRNVIIKNSIKECHFVALCALLLLLYHPINTWCSKLVDQSLDLGRNIFKYATHKEHYENRVVNNVFLEEKFFDLIISELKRPRITYDQKLRTYFDFYLRKRNFLMLQFPSMCMALYVTKKYHHLFDPYQYKKFKARWIRFNTRKEFLKYIATHVGGIDCCTFYTFNVTRIRDAPKALLIPKKLAKCQLKQQQFKECIDKKKPLNESEKWVKCGVVRWSRLSRKNAQGKLRGTSDTMWKEWDIEYPNDLWSLWGNLHQKSKCFAAERRGKQTICNCIVCCIIVVIYDFSEWNPILLDSILKDGNQYYILCVREMLCDDKKGEFNVQHLKPEVNIPPFTAKITVTPVLEGTMFVQASQQYNLYGGLFTFFRDVERRLGLIFATRDDYHRILAFGKVRENEYFMYDCQAYGPPLFLDKQGCSYILRMNSLRRLVYTMTVTLRDGDFYIYDVQVTDIKDITRG